MINTELKNIIPEADFETIGRFALGALLALVVLIGLIASKNYSRVKVTLGILGVAMAGVATGAGWYAMGIAIATVTFLVLFATGDYSRPNSKLEQSSAQDPASMSDASRFSSSSEANTRSPIDV